MRLICGSEVFVIDLLETYLPIGFFLIFALVMSIFILGGRKRASRDLREMPAFNQLKRMLGLAVETGKQLHVSIGWGELSGIPAAAVVAGLTILERVARAASISDDPPIATSGDGLTTILAKNTLRAAYKDLGIESQFDSASGQVAGLTPYSYAAGTLDVIADPKVSANLFTGHFSAEVALLSDRAERNGAVILGGSDHLSAQAVQFAASPDPLIGEELYAGGAYLGGVGVHIASLKAQDVMRWVLIVVLVLGAIGKFLGF